MKNKPLLLLLTGLVMSILSLAQTPGVRNTKYLNTTNDGEGIYDMKATPDNGFIVVGVDSAFAFDKSQIATKSYRNLGFIAKLDSGGNIIWRRTNQANAWESAFLSVVLSSDGGYVTTGYKRDPAPPYDTSQLIICKYNASGTLLWEKIYGGSLQDAGYSIAKTSTGGYVIAGYTVSNDGDVTGNHGPGYSDVWLIKTDADGNAIWKRCLGGSLSDSAYCVIETKNKDYVVVGSSRSSDGDLRENGGMTDAWIIRTDTAGFIRWQQKLGGSNMDGFKSVVENEDGSLSATGYIMSSDSEVPMDFGLYGKSDLLLAKYDRFLMFLWGAHYGGAGNETGMSITRTQDGNHIITGFTESNNMDVSGNNGLTDAWIIKVSGEWMLMWQKCIGTNKEEFGTSVVCLSENNFVVAGIAQPPTPGGPGDFTDGYIAKLGNSNTIKGVLYLDANLNNGKDPGEPFFNNAIVKSTKSGGYEHSSIPVNGLFQIDVETGTFTTQPFIQSPYYTVVPPSHISNFPTYFNTDSFSFAIQPIPGMQDLTISAVALNVARPGFDVNYKLDYRNKGTTTVANGTILFKKDSRLSLLSAVPPISSSNGDTLKWDYSNLQSLDSGSITLNLHISAPPTVNLGDTLKSIAIITPVAGDATPSDDTAILRQRVQGSYDPNDKAENLGGNITLQEVSSADYITYVIRFQNTGTDTAFNVIVRDTLDNKLDWNTLEMVGASHPYQMQISSSSMLAWTFNGINLPDSNKNEPASHGYLAYRIRPKTNLALNDIIANNAGIYFDFNLPVLTLDALTQVIDITLPLHLLEFSASYQKPDALLEWSTAEESNVDKFIIERGIDPIHFAPVGTVAAKNGNGITRYQFKDGLASTSGEKFYYRLKMMDIDRKFKYSNVELVQRVGKAINELVINPNPVRGKTGFAWINLQKEVRAEIGVVDMKGNYRSLGQQQINKGFNVVPLDFFGLSAGNYLLQVKIGQERLISRFVLVQ